MLSRVHAFDLRFDALVDRVRSPKLDPVFYGLSSAADHGLLWLLVAAGRAARRGDPAIALRMGAALGTESLLTNGPIKALFQRVRPEDDHPPEGPLPYGMHRPITSSFPSGHAAAVAASRVYTRMHHSSDVVAGAALGLVLGAIARRVVPLG